MSTLTYGPAVVLDGPVPAAYPYGLLNVARVVDEPSDYWLNGASVYPYPGEDTDGYDPCSAGTFRVKADGAGVDVQLFAAFVVYLPITCSAMSVGDPDEFKRRAALALAAREQAALERQLAAGSYIATNPYLGDANMTQLGAAAVSGREALERLENAVGGTEQAGVIHADPATVSCWSRDYLLYERQGKLRTANGTPVVSGGGYIGLVPDGEAVLGARESWAFGSGPVDVRHTETVMVPDPIFEALDRSINEVTFRAERYALVTWDAQLQVGVLIDRSV